MTVHIHIEGASGAEVRKQIADLLGGPQMIVSSDIDMSDLEPGSIASRPVTVSPAAPPPPVDNEHVAEGAEPFSPEVIAANAPKRERGKPSPGHARRTKAEIAEDEAADVIDAQAVAMQRQNEVVEAASASVVEDTPEVQAADAADEAAETAANKPADAPPTAEDIRNVLGTYVKVYGMDAAMADGPVVISEICGEGVVKVSSVPEDKIADVIAALKKAGNENRFQRAQVAS